MAGYTEEEIKISNNVIYIHKNDNEIISENKKYNAYSVFIELIDNCNIKEIPFLKDSTTKELEKVNEGLKLIIEDFVNELEKRDMKGENKNGSK